MSVELDTYRPAQEPGGVGVVHLVWAPLGLPSFGDFLDSYRRHAAGLPHELILLVKGFPGDTLPDAYRARLDGLAHRLIPVPDSGYDLGSYFLAAERCGDCHTLCFLNSRSVILDDGWLAKLHATFCQPGVGVVGVAGNYESVYSNVLDFLRAGARRSFLRGIVRRVRAWRILRQVRRDFDPFPNPHLRTNAFLIDRRLLLELTGPPFRTKMDCYRFESGKQGFTRQVAARGLATLVVGRDGCAYPPAEWPASETFRQGEQRNLLVADNRTRQYVEGDEALRRELAAMAWSDVRQTS